MSKHRQFSKILLKIMRITCYQIFITILCTSLGYAIDTQAQELLERKVSIQVSNQEIGRALERIEKVADVHFMYSPQIIASKRKVTLVAKNERLATILDGLLRPLNLTYEVVGNKILLNRITTPSNLTPESHRSEIRTNQMLIEQPIKGTVTDESGLGLPGVSVLVKGTNKGTITGVDGGYTLVVPNNNAVLVFSFVGYESQEIAIGNQTSVDVKLKTDVKSLGEIVVVGYGQVKKSDLTGSVASVKAKDITAFPITTPVQGIQGRVSGVQVIQNSGAPGSSISVRIRGGNSLRASNEPLYVVDGFALSGSLSALNPSDIESIEVLKDASATAIYGSRGANGVVIVTTKKGKAGKSQIDVESFYGVQSPTKLIEMMNAREMAEIANERAANDGVSAFFTAQEVASFGEGTNWQKELLRSAPIQNHGATFSGGSERMQYSFSTNILSQDGIVPNSSYKKGTIRGNINHRVNDKLTFDFSMILSRLNQRRIDGENSNRGNGALSAILVAPPTVTPFTPQGDYSNVVPYSFSSNVLLNPFALVNERRDQDVQDYVLANTAINYEILKGLTLRVSGGIEAFNNRRDQYSTRKLSTSPSGSASVSTSRQTNLLNENILNYARTWGQNHSLTLTTGLTYQNQKNNSLSAGGSGFASDVLTTNALQGAATPGIPGSGASEWTLLSYLGRVNYTFKDRYLLTASYRADGSSRFGKNNKWGYFPSAAFAWRAIEEDFMKQQTILSDLKFRVSWGQTGNTALSPYQTLNSLSSYQTIFGNDLAIGYAPSSSLSNPTLKWETTTQTDIGVDLGFLRDRLRVTADYYMKDTKDLLAIVSLPTSAGYASTTQNIGEIQNSGVELGIDANVFSGEFKWDISANTSFNRNKVKYLVGGSDIFGAALQNPLGVPVSLVRVGQPVGVFFGYQENGLNEKGEIVFKDLNNDGIINTNDKTIIGNPNPKAIFGFSSSASYKNFELNLFLQGVQGVDLFNFNVASFANSFNFGENQIRDLYLNRWTPQNPNPNAKYPKVSVNTKFRESDRYVENGSFMRLKNIQLAYNIPTSGIKWLRKAQVYVSGQNLLTLTKYSWYDPEVSTLGGSTSISPGVDQFGYPVAKTITLGARLGF